MPEVIKQNALYIGIGVFVLILVVFGVVLMMQGGSDDEEVDAAPFDDEQVVEEIEYVDDSVEVNLEFINAGREIELEVDNVPEATDVIEIELSYQTETKGFQGVIAEIDVEEGATTATTEKPITLGTCSSGTCIYHQVIDEIQVNLKFEGDYGERLYQNIFPFES